MERQQCGMRARKTSARILLHSGMRCQLVWAENLPRRAKESRSSAIAGAWIWCQEERERPAGERMLRNSVHPLHQWSKPLRTERRRRGVMIAQHGGRCGDRSAG